VVAAGEDSAVAAVRELAEELGIDGVIPQFVGEAHHNDGFSREICRAYRVVHDGPYRFDDGEVTEARLVDAAQLRSLLEAESFLPSSIAMLFPLIELT
jgi:8-oxo-dGTP pyrophosphatase MutT (NUDIX family)